MVFVSPFFIDLQTIYHTHPYYVICMGWIVVYIIIDLLDKD